MCVCMHTISQVLLLLWSSLLLGNYASLHAASKFSAAAFWGAKRHANYDDDAEKHRRERGRERGEESEAGSARHLTTTFRATQLRTLLSFPHS